MVNALQQAEMTHVWGEFDAGSAGGYTIINSGTIEVTDKGANAIRLNNKVNNTITNTGSILGGPEQAFSVAGSGSSFRIGKKMLWLLNVMKLTTAMILLVIHWVLR